MIVGSIRHEQVLRLVQNVVGPQREGKLIFEQAFVQLRVQDDLGFLGSRVAAVPVVIRAGLEFQVTRKSPGHLSVDLVGPGRQVRRTGQRVPGFAHPGTSAEFNVHEIIPVRES